MSASPEFIEYVKELFIPLDNVKEGKFFGGFAFKSGSKQFAIPHCPECGIKINKQVLKESKHFKRVDDNCNYVQWNNPIPVVTALVKHNGKYIVARNAQWPKKIFFLITGFLESGEKVVVGLLHIRLKTIQ